MPEEKRMRITVDAGKTLLVDGPASVTLVSGETEVFGHSLRQTGKVVIRDGKRMPFIVKEKATFDILLGENASIEEVDGDTVPMSWEEAYKEVVAIQKRPLTLLVLGNVDSGKTSFCTYLANKLVKDGCKVAILDGDIGQSDIGPPCTVAYALVSKPVTDLFNLEATNAYFVGVTSPSRALERVIRGIISLREELLKHNPDYIIVNTDGWVEGEEAVSYKLQIVEKIAPDMVFGIQQSERLTPILTALKNFKTLAVDSPQTIKQRSRDKRRSLRELGYIKYLKGAKIQSIPMSWVKVENDEIIGSNRTFGMAKREKEIYSLLGMKPLHIAELKDKIHVIIGKGRWISPEKIRSLEEVLGKKVTVACNGDEEGSLTALYNAEGKFLGIGVLRKIDYIRKVLKIFTPVSGSISTVVIGKVRLDKNLREISSIQDEAKVL
ncbi:MAG: Clp1/GlmU family protein [Candidatus Bathyarchaeia archaeon]|nr:hypothetical protein [Candidatus Bathyarchaeota archaeon]